MADTADLRSEGKFSHTKEAQYARLRARNFELAGLCNMCGKTPVKNRKTCYACSADQKDKTYLAGLRHHLKKAGLSLKLIDRIDEDKAIDILYKLLNEAQYVNRR